jgi:hypothetical protein
MTTTAKTTFEIETVSATDIDNARRTGTDAFGNPVERVELTGGEPLRCCLRNARPGETAILFGYEPHIPASPYREIGAVFVHATPCDGPVSLTRYPDEWRGRPQVLRAYDAQGWIHPASQVHDARDPESVIADMFADPTVAQIHSRNIAYGCYMFTLRRPA